MKKLSLCLLFFTMIIAGCAQQKTIKKGWAFLKISNPGIERKDINGNPMGSHADTLNVIYLETANSTAPIIDSAFLEGRLMSAGVYTVAANEREIGVPASGGKKIILQPASTHSLWRIELTPAPVFYYRPRPGKICLKGRSGSRQFNYTANNVIPLLSEIRY